MISSKLLCVSCSALLLASVPVAAQTLTWPALVSVHKNASGAPNNFEVSAASISLDGFLVAPDGTIFSGLGEPITGLSQTDVTTRFAGEWVINDQENLPLGETQQHLFTVPSSSLIISSDSFPVVDSPTEGATVPPVFRVKWRDFDEGTSFSIRGAHLSEVTHIGEDHVQFRAMFQPGELVKAMSFTAFAADTTRLPRATSLSANPTSRFDPSVQRVIASLPRDFFVVIPEPSTLALAASTLFALSLIRRRPPL